jgi:hypothetical protein
MARLLYGSSNIYRHFARMKKSLLTEFELVRCTKKAVFDSHVSSLEDAQPGSVIITSVLANFIVDACQGLADAAVPLFGGQQITAHVESLAELVRKCSNITVYIVPPLLRKTPGTCPYVCMQKISVEKDKHRDR